MSAASAWPSGYALKQFDEIDSTNEEARRMAVAGHAGPTWITAARQNAGRGRRARPWESPVGNLYATLLIDPKKPVAECAQLSFVAAIAAADAIAPHARGAEVRVKWPNDVLVGGRKIAGLLLESASAGAGAPHWLAIGIGINLAAHPEGTEFPATSLGGLGVAVPEPRALLTELAVQFAKWYEVWALRGFHPIQDAWLARAAGLGSRIRARLTHEEIWGVFEGIDDTGALQLRVEQGKVRTIAAGEVFF